MAAVLGVASIGSRAGGRDRGRARLAFYYPLMLVVFTDLERTAPVIAPVAGDPLLQAWDLALVGMNLSVVIAPHLTPFTVELLSVGYCMFYVYLFGWGLLWLRESEPRAQAFYIGLFTLYPAPLQGYGLTDLMLVVYPEGSNGAFPSLHSGLTLFILGFDWLAGYRVRALLCLPLAVLMWIATVALRFHYLVDVLAGLVLALPCLALAATRLAVSRPHAYN